MKIKISRITVLSKNIVKLSMQMAEEEYKGYKIEAWEEIEEDNKKTLTSITGPDGESVSSPNITPYIGTHYAVSLIKLWIDAGKPDGHFDNAEQLKEIIRENIKMYVDNFGIMPPHLRDSLAKAFKNRKIEAQNNINMGAEVNMGMQPASTTLSKGQETQIVSNPMDSLSKEPGTDPLKNWKKTLNQKPRTKGLLSLTPQQMALQMGIDLPKDPKTKEMMQKIIDDSSKDPAKASQAFKTILNNVEKMKEKEMKAQQSQVSERPQASQIANKPQSL